MSDQIPLQDVQINTDTYDSEVNKIESWFTIDNKNYFFNYKTINGLPPGLYNMVFSQQNGFGLSVIDYQTDDVFYLPNLPYDEIITDINKFLDRGEKFAEYKISPKRGIIVYGKPGCGKTSLIYLLIEEIKKKNGIAIYFDEPAVWMEVTKIVRKLEPNRPILCIMEDLDLIIEKFGEQEFLNFLDGVNQVENVVYIGTTNHIKEIPQRIKDRPSRFDRKYEIKKPTNKDRKYYVENKLVDSDKEKISVEKIVKDTSGFTIAQVKELIISTFILENDYDETLKRLREVKIDDNNSIGFLTKNN